MPLGSAATRPKTRLLRPPALRFEFAQLMKVAAASTTIPVTNAAMQEYAKISLRTVGILTPVRLPLFAPPLEGHSSTVAKR